MNALAIQSNGEIVAVGTGQGNTATAGTFNVDRFTTSGALDPAFGADGTVTTTFPQTALGDGATTELVEPDGNILVSGGAGAPAKDGAIVDHQVLALYNPAGTLDQAFGTGGLIQHSTGGQLPTLAVDAAGDIFATDGAELSPAGQPLAHATAATIVATSGGNAGVIDPNVAVQGQAFLPNAQVVTGLGLSFGRRIVGVQAELSNADGTTATGFFNPAFPIGYIPQGVRLTAYSAEAADLPPAVLQEFIDAVGEGAAVAPIGAVYQIDQIVEAHTVMEEGRVAGKIVLLT